MIDFLCKQNFEDYIKKYSKIITDYLINESDLRFSLLEQEFDVNHENYCGSLQLEWDTLEWYNYFHEFKPEINIKDYEIIEKLTRAFSKYIPYAISNIKTPKYCKYENFITEIFLKECYINAIINYTKEYSKYFNDPNLLDVTLEFFNDDNFEQTCLLYFDNLG